MLADALKVTDKKARAAKYEEATRIVVDEAPGLWISNTKWFGPWSKSLEGIRFSPVGDGQEMRWAHFKG